MEMEGGVGEGRTPRGLGTDDQTGLQPHITSQFEPKSRASHGLLQLREKGDRRVGMEVCNGAWTGGQAYGLLLEEGGKRKRRDWEISSDDEDESENESRDREFDRNLGDVAAEGDEARREAGGRGAANASDGAEQPSLEPQPVEYGLEEAVRRNGIVEQHLTGASDSDPLKEARGKEEAPGQRQDEVLARDNDVDNHVDHEVDDDIDADVDNGIDADVDNGIDADVDNHIDNEDDTLEIEIEIEDEEDNEEGGAASGDGGNSGQGTINDRDGTVGSRWIANSDQMATTEPEAGMESQEMSPRSLSLCAHPCSVEGTPSMHAPARSPPSLAPLVDFDSMKGPGKAAMCSEIAEIADIATRAPLATTTYTNNDRLALAIMGNDSAADIRSMLSSSLGNGFAAGSESNLPPALVCACQHDSARNTDIVSALLEHGADVNESFKGDGFTPLIQCAKTGNFGMMVRLLEGGADVERVCKGGRSALLVAIDKGRAEMARRLLPSSRSINGIRIDRGRTALMEAARRGQADVVEALVEHGADVDLVDESQKTALMLSLEEGMSNKKILKLLMSERSVNLVDEMGATPLEVAISKKLASAPQLLVDSQCELGEYKRKIVGTEEAQTCVPLIHAIVHNAGTLLVRKMLERGASAQCAVDGKTALMHAAELGESQIVSDLIKAGADPLTEYGNGMTALLWAARMGHKSASRVLMTAMGIGPPNAVNQ